MKSAFKNGDKAMRKSSKQPSKTPKIKRAENQKQNKEQDLKIYNTSRKLKKVHFLKTQNKKQKKRMKVRR